MRQENAQSDILHLFEQAVLFLNAGDLRAALSFFKEYLARGGTRESEARAYVRQIGEDALKAGNEFHLLGERLRTHALDNFNLARDSGAEAVARPAAQSGGEAESPLDEIPSVQTSGIGDGVHNAAPAGGAEGIVLAEPAVAPEPPRPTRPSMSGFRSVRSPKPPASAAAALSPPGTIVSWYPHMRFSEPPPLAPGTEFEVRVSADQSAPEPGELSSPIKLPDLPVCHLMVRLLPSAHFQIMGAAVQPLRIDRAKTESETAVFKVSIQDAATLEALGDEPAALCAIFLHENRPAGRVLKHIALEGLTNKAPAETPKPKDKDTEIVSVETGTRAADLTITVVAQEENDNRHFWCTVQTELLPELAGGASDVWNPASATGTLVTGYMRDFAARGLSPIERLANLRSAGKLLYSASPKVFQDAFWKIVDSGVKVTTIAIISSEPYFPWELMIPWRHTLPGLPPQVLEPLGVAYRMGRMTRRSLIAGAQSIPLKDGWVVAPVYASRPLAQAQAEAAWLKDNFKTCAVTADIESLDVAFANSRSLLHIACHGEARENGQVLYLDNDQEFTALKLWGLSGAETGIATARPLVFLNACQVGRLGADLIGPGGFAPAFMELGARAVVAPLWSVKDTLAHEVAMAFYTNARDHKDIAFAETLQRLRSKAYDVNNPEDTYAAYCFYGDPLAMPQ